VKPSWFRSAENERTNVDNVPHLEWLEPAEPDAMVERDRQTDPPIGLFVRADQRMSSR
jgi:hypothetical protein